MGVRGAMNLRGGAPHFVLRVFEPDRFYLSETLGLLLSNRRTGRQLGVGQGCPLKPRPLNESLEMASGKLTWECQSHVTQHSDHLPCLSQGSWGLSSELGKC